MFSLQQLLVAVVVIVVVLTFNRFFLSIRRPAHPVSAQVLRPRDRDKSCAVTNPETAQTKRHRLEPKEIYHGMTDYLKQSN